MNPHRPCKILATLLLLIALIGLITPSAMADTITKVKITFSGIPTDGNTIVVNGATRTLKNTVTSAATQAAIGGSANATAANLLSHLTGYPFAGTSAISDGAAVVTIVGGINQTITASGSGVNFTVVVAVTTISQYPLILPLSGENSSRRTPIANDLITSLNAYATAPFETNAIALSNYVALTTTQSISGFKTFTGPNVYSNASQMFTMGSISNAAVTTLYLDYVNHGLTFRDATNEVAAEIVPDVTGYPQMFFTNRTLSGMTVFPKVPVQPGYLLNAWMANTFYPQLTEDNTMSGANTFANITNSLIASSRTTNMIGGFTNLWVTNLFVQKAVSITNGNLNAITFTQPAAAADNRIWVMGGTSTNFGILVNSDDGVTSSWAVRLSRNGTTPDAMLISCANLNVTSAATFTGALYSTAGLRAAGVSVLGSSSSSTAIPGSLSAGALFFDGTGAGADPAAGSVQWSESGALKYRGQAADGGSGGDRFLHNRAAEVTGSGSDFTPAGTGFARLDFGGTDVQISLPTASTYLVSADLDYTQTVADYDLIKAKLFNSSTAADIPNSERWTSNTKTGSHSQLILQSIVTTTTANNVLQIYVANTTAARGTFGAILTNIRYVRLY